MSTTVESEVARLFDMLKELPEKLGMAELERRIESLETRAEASKTGFPARDSAALTVAPTIAPLKIDEVRKEAGINTALAIESLQAAIESVRGEGRFQPLVEAQIIETRFQRQQQDLQAQVSNLASQLHLTADRMEPRLASSPSRQEMRSVSSAQFEALSAQLERLNTQTMRTEEQQRRQLQDVQTQVSGLVSKVQAGSDRAEMHRSELARQLEAVQSQAALSEQEHRRQLQELKFQPRSEGRAVSSAQVEALSAQLEAVSAHTVRLEQEHRRHAQEARSETSIVSQVLGHAPPASQGF